MKIAIDEIENGRWRVRCGDLYEDQLCRDEILHVVAVVLIQGPEHALKRSYARALLENFT